MCGGVGVCVGGSRSVCVGGGVRGECVGGSKSVWGTKLEGFKDVIYKSCPSIPYVANLDMV